MKVGWDWNVIVNSPNSNIFAQIRCNTSTHYIPGEGGTLWDPGGGWTNPNLGRSCPLRLPSGGSSSERGGTFPNLGKYKPTSGWRVGPTETLGRHKPLEINPGEGAGPAAHPTSLQEWDLPILGLVPPPHTHTHTHKEVQCRFHPNTCLKPRDAPVFKAALSRLVMQGFVKYMEKICPNLKQNGVVIGYDARHNSQRQVLFCF